MPRYSILKRGPRAAWGIVLACALLAPAVMAQQEPPFPEEPYPETGPSETQTECYSIPVSISEPGDDFPETTSVEQCPTQTGSATSTQLFTFVNDLRTRIIQQRRARRVLDSQQDDEQTAAAGWRLGGAASADDEVSGVSAYGRLSPFVIADFADSDRERTDAGQAYDQDTESLILGADYRVDDTLFVGGTLSYLSGDTEFANDAGDIDIDAYLIGLHGSKYWGNNLFMDALVTYGQLKSDITRNINVPGGPRYTASPDGEEMAAEVAVGYEYSRGRTRLTPLAKLHYFDGKLDAYDENGQPSLFGPQSVGEQDFDALNLQLALQADTVYLMDWGVLIPSLNLSYYREFSDANTVQVSTGPFTTVSQEPDDPDRHTFVIRLGAHAQFTHGWAAFFSLEKLLHHDYMDRNNVVVGVRHEIF